MDGLQQPICRRPRGSGGRSVDATEEFRLSKASLRSLKNARLEQASWPGGRQPESGVAAGDATPGGQPGTERRGADREDEALLVRVASRDPAAFRLIVDRHMPRLIMLARRLLRDDAEAEDVAQEAMLRLWRLGQGLEVGPAGVGPWLKRVVSNLAIDKLRVRGRVDVTDEVPEQPQAADQLRRLERRELADRVEEALRGLPDRQRLALTMFHYEGLSMQEVGSMMGVSAEAVESLLARARRSLKVALAGEWQAMRGDSASEV
jgi:RNA polymerase sigma-70 factor (ECF subfamily)